MRSKGTDTHSCRRGEGGCNTCTHLVCVGLDAADEEGVGRAERGHQRVQRVLQDNKRLVTAAVLLPSTASTTEGTTYTHTGSKDPPPGPTNWDQEPGLSQVNLHQPGSIGASWMGECTAAARGAPPTRSSAHARPALTLNWVLTEGLRLLELLLRVSCLFRLHTCSNKS